MQMIENVDCGVTDEGFFLVFCGVGKRHLVRDHLNEGGQNAIECAAMEKGSACHDLRTT